MSNPKVRWFGVKDSEESVEEEDPWAYGPWSAFMTGKPIRPLPSLEEKMRGKMHSKPSLPANYHPQEISSYSPALKKTGGYSYSLSATSGETETANPFAKPKEPRNYKPNFLMPFNIPEASAEQQEEDLIPEAQETKRTDKLNNSKGVPDDGIMKYPLGNGVWVDANGRAVKPPRRF